MIQSDPLHAMRFSIMLTWHCPRCGAERTAALSALQPCTSSIGTNLQHPIFLAISSPFRFLNLLQLFTLATHQDSVETTLVILTALVKISVCTAQV